MTQPSSIGKESSEFHSSGRLAYFFHHDYCFVPFMHMCVCVTEKGESLMGSGFHAPQQEAKSSCPLSAMIPLSTSVVHLGPVLVQGLWKWHYQAQISRA